MLGFGLSDVAAPLLPRPFSIGARTGSDAIGLLVRGFGRGTSRLCGLKTGDEVLLLGPLGRPFELPSQGSIACVAGGVGLAPFLFLAPSARAAGLDCEIIYGERTGDRVFAPELVEAVTGVQPTIYTESGEVGRRGRVLEGLRPAEGRRLYGCGPTPMLRALEAYARERDLWLQVSVEEHMGCGVGTCQGCVVRSAAGQWIKSCTEGPVFERRELSWDD